MDSEAQSRTIRACDLPIYRSVEKTQNVWQADESPGWLETRVGSLRHSLGITEETTEKWISKWEVAKAHSEDLKERFYTDPNIVPHAGFISLAGLTGILLGHRGGSIRRVTYCACGGLAAASLCYPDRAVDLTRLAGASAKRRVLQAWGSDLQETVTTTEKAETTVQQTYGSRATSNQDNSKADS